MAYHSLTLLLLEVFSCKLHPMNMKSGKRKIPARRLLVGVLVIILLGTALLSLPWATKPGRTLTFFEAIYTATTSFCVTGLPIFSIGETFTTFGHIVIIIFVQIGGIGYASLAIFLLMVLGKTIDLSNRSLIRESLNTDSWRGLISLVKIVLIFSLVIEFTGAAILLSSFLKVFSPIKAVGYSIFHAISAFNNAGIDLFDVNVGISHFQHDITFNITTMVLIFFGGLGFVVIRDMFVKRRWKRLTMHSKIVLTMSIILIIAGALLLYALEDISFLTALFHSTSARSSGFTTADIFSFSNSGMLILMMLMVIGASPGSTGGGIKTTTFFTVINTMFNISARRRIGAFNRRIPQESVIKAFAVVLFSIMAILGGFFLLTVIEGDRYSFFQLAFEAVTAYSTVGFSQGISGDLRTLSQAVLMVLMLMGRLGPLTIISTWAPKAPQISRVEEKILIG